MDCKQIEKLLPLYAGGDLDGQSERLITAHLESCPACSAAAGEFEQTRDLVREFAPPAFSEDVFARIRQSVWRQIESESSTRSWWDDVFALFHPRLTTAFVTVVLVAVAAWGIYFIANRLSRQNRIAGTVPFVNPQAPDKEQPSGSPDNGARVQTITSNETPGTRLAVRHPTHQRIHREVIADRADSAVVAQTAPSISVETSTVLDDSARSDTSADDNSGKTLRMEIQTKNPNIRIIWFSPRDTRRVFPKSKGI